MASITLNEIAKYTPVFLDANGKQTAQPAGVTFTAADQTLLELSWDGTTLVVTPVAVGTTTISAAGLAGTETIEISVAAAASVNFGAPQLEAKP